MDRMTGHNAHTSIPLMSVSLSETNPLYIQEVTTLAEFENLKPQWNNILTRSANPTVFLTYEWLNSWWKSISTVKNELRILLVKEHDEIIGIAPFMLVKDSFLGLPVTKIEFISMMKYGFSVINCSGSLDCIIVRRHNEVAQRIVAYLYDHSDRWDILRLFPLPEYSSLMRQLQHDAGLFAFRITKRVVLHNAVLSVGAHRQYSDYPLATSTRRKSERYERKLTSLGEVKLFVYDDSNSIRRGFQELLTIEQNSWKSKRGIPITSKYYNDFYEQLSISASNENLLRLFILKCGNVPIAYDLCLEFLGMVFSLKSSFDERYKGYSPGIVLTYKEFEYHFSKDVRSINLLWGNLDTKMQWTPELEPHYEVLGFNYRLYSRILFLLQTKLHIYRLIRYISRRINRF